MPHRPHGEAGEPSRTLRLLGVRSGRTHQIIILTDTPRVLGLLYHWHDKVPWYCPPDRPCLKAVHEKRQFWHGYLPILEREDTASLWIPSVLEVTPALELDMRGRTSRGAWWSVSRRATRKRTAAVTGTYLGQWNAAELPPAHRIGGCVATIYGEKEVDLSTPNPMPDRVPVDTVQLGDAPKRVGAEADEPLPATEIRRMLREAGLGAHAPKPSETRAVADGSKVGLNGDRHS